MDTLRLITFDWFGKRRATPRCSFCNQTRTESRKLVFGPRDVRICSECVDRIQGALQRLQ